MNELAERLRKELRGYSVDARIRRGDTPDHVTVVFRAERNLNALYMHASPVVYHSQQAFSATLGFALDTHHNYASFAWTSTADELVERNEGWRLRYEHRRVGTSIVQVGVGYDWFHPTLLAPTQAALALSPDVPGAYRTREDFAPSVSVLPVNGVKVTFGLSLQNLGFDLPTPHTGHAFAFTADAQAQRKVTSRGGYRHAISAAYSLRRATPALESDFVYTRHLVAGDYSLTKRRHGFVFQGRLGTIEGAAPPVATTTTIFDSSGGGNYGFEYATAKNWLANKFCLGPQSYTLDSVALSLTSRDLNNPVAVRLQIYADDPLTGKPGTVAGRVSGDDLTGAVATLLVPGAADPGTPALVAKAPISADGSFSLAGVPTPARRAPRPRCAAPSSWCPTVRTSRSSACASPTRSTATWSVPTVWP